MKKEALLKFCKITLAQTRTLALLLFAGYAPLVVGVPLAAEEELELGVVSLFVHRHLLKLGPVPSHEVRQFVYYVLQLHI